MGSHYRGNKDEIRALNAFINLTRASESLMAVQAHRLSAGGITVTQWGVLEALYHLGPMSQTQLGKKLLKTGGNITLVVHNLEKRSLIQRKRDKDDRRYLEINLTAKGTRLVEKLLSRHVAGITGDMGCLSAGELEDLRRMCRKLGKSLEDN
ncbi:MAG: MarR family transcriptional regulator [Candidatus Latescibacterota bacterium]